jgi:hypothetical protein
MNYKKHYDKVIEIMQDHKITKMTKVRILNSAIIPSFAGACICSICEDDIEDDTQTIFDVPYHSEYAHTKCFEKAVQ